MSHRIENYLFGGNRDDVWSIRQSIGLNGAWYNRLFANDSVLLGYL
jgi:hypothetical protein